MTIYYLTFLTLFIIGFIYERLQLKKNAEIFFIAFVLLLMQLVYGLRYEVGVDWFNYIDVYERHVGNAWSFSTPEIAYKYLNVFSDMLGTGIVGVVFISTLFLLVFSFAAPYRLGINPFYYMAVVAPYHLVVSGMNLTRQAIAISIFIFAITYLLQKRKLLYALWIIAASMFHFSAILMLGFLFIDFKKRYLLPPLLFIVIPLLAVALKFYDQYLDTDMQNAGLILRVGFLFPAAFLILAHKKKWVQMDLIRFRLCLVTVLMGPALLAISLLSSTMADRFSYYFIVLAALLIMEQVISSKRRSFDLMTYASPILCITAIVAFVVWHIGSGYISLYEFEHLFFFTESF